MRTYSAHFLSPAQEYLDALPEADRGTIAADIDVMRSGDLATPYTKQLKGPICELISGHHRLTYFVTDGAIYFVRGFRKKSGKTPRKEIEYAQDIYKRAKR